MLLSELHGYRQYADKTISQIVRTLQGFDINEDGAYSFVMISRDHQHVYKVWGDDPGYEAYLEIVKRMQGNKYVPKLLSRVHKIPAFFKRPANVDGFIKIVKLEKLTPLKARNHITTQLANFLHNFARTKISLTGFDKEYTRTDIASFIKSVERLKSFSNPAAYGQHGLDERSLEAVKRLQAQWVEIATTLHDSSDDLYELARELHECAKINQHIFGFDIHEENIMLRGSQIVIIDPLASTQLESDRIKSKIVYLSDFNAYNKHGDVLPLKTGQRPSIK